MAEACHSASGHRGAPALYLKRKTPERRDTATCLDSILTTWQRMLQRILQKSFGDILHTAQVYLQCWGQQQTGSDAGAQQAGALYSLSTA